MTEKPGLTEVVTEAVLKGVIATSPSKVYDRFLQLCWLYNLSPYEVAREITKRGYYVDFGSGQVRRL